MLSAVCVTLAVVVAVASAGDAPWDYKEIGRDWAGTCRTGVRQSPIALSLLEAVHNPNLGHLKFDYNPDLTNGFYVNNKHSVAFVLAANQTKSKLSSGGLPGTYILHSLHFHWGVSDYDGSEHVVEYDRAPLEVHLVHYNSRYADLGEAKAKSDGLAVVGILFSAAKDSKVAAESKVGQFVADEYSGILDQLQLPGAQLNDRHVNMTKYIEDIVGGTNSNFFRYLGSLTTPGCDESVTWTVMTKRAEIEPAVLAKFRAVHLVNAQGEHKTSLNYRSIQKLNGRVVYSNDKSARGSLATQPGCPSGVAMATSSSRLLASSAVLAAVAKMAVF